MRFLRNPGKRNLRTEWSYRDNRIFTDAADVGHNVSLVCGPGNHTFFGVYENPTFFFPLRQHIECFVEIFWTLWNNSVITSEALKAIFLTAFCETQTVTCFTKKNSQPTCAQTKRLYGKPPKNVKWPPQDEKRRLAGSIWTRVLQMSEMCKQGTRRIIIEE